MGALSLSERKAFGAILLICIASILFWAGFEQAGSSLNLFTRDFTNRLVRISKFLSLGSNQLIDIHNSIVALFCLTLINLSKRLTKPYFWSKMCGRFITNGFRIYRDVLCSTICSVWPLKSPQVGLSIFFAYVGELCIVR